MKSVKRLLIISFILLGLALLLSLGPQNNTITLPVTTTAPPKVIMNTTELVIHEQATIMLRHPTFTQKIFAQGTSMPGHLYISPFTLLYFLVMNGLLLFVHQKNKSKDMFTENLLAAKILQWGLTGYILIDQFLLQTYSYYIIKDATAGAYRINSPVMAYYIFIYFGIALSLLLTTTQKGIALQKEQELTV